MKTRWKERIKQKYNHLATRDLPFFFFFWLFFPLASSFVVCGFENVRFYLYEQVNQSYLRRQTINTHRRLCFNGRRVGKHRFHVHEYVAQIP